MQKFLNNIIFRAHQKIGKVKNELTPKQKERISLLHGTLGEFEKDINKWFDNFQRENDVNWHLRIWEVIAKVYDEFAAGDKNRPRRRETYGIIFLKISYVAKGRPDEGDAKLLDLEHLDSGKTQEIMDRVIEVWSKDKDNKTKFDSVTRKAVADTLRMAANRACFRCSIHQTPSYSVTQGGHFSAPSAMEWVHGNTPCKAAAIHDTAADLNISL